jgi:hypothetical protein
MHSEPLIKSSTSKVCAHCECMLARVYFFCARRGCMYVCVKRIHAWYGRMHALKEYTLILDACMYVREESTRVVFACMYESKTRLLWMHVCVLVVNVYMRASKDAHACIFQKNTQMCHISHTSCKVCAYATLAWDNAYVCTFLRLESTCIHAFMYACMYSYMHAAAGLRPQKTLPARPLKTASPASICFFF